jgi:SAM-dependent methyltransferase
LLTLQELSTIFDVVGELRGWDWSRLRLDSDKPDWDYIEVVRGYISGGQRALDIGTGGGEVLFELSESFAGATAIDHSRARLRVAQENGRSQGRQNVDFCLMDACALGLTSEAFDLVLNRHCSIYADEVARVLKPGGVFVSQQVGGRNSQNIFDVFGWGSNGDFWRRYNREHGIRDGSMALAEVEFQDLGCRVLERRDSDVKQYFLDVESLVFFLKSAPLPEDFIPEQHVTKLNDYLEKHTTDRGIETNEHRELLVIQKS